MVELMLVVMPSAVLLETPVPLSVTLLDGKGLVNVNVALMVSVMAVVLGGEVPVGKLRV
jgi:hypothetical protein